MALRLTGPTNDPLDCACHRYRVSECVICLREESLVFEPRSGRGIMPRAQPAPTLPTYDLEEDW